ncbi:restriction endonuclease subunit S [Aeromonas rivipollensis]|uniref:restriction endonuclease subunit S n=1 Tax=Aeromonas rivipollensis TaxID=948519 RepID=UPI003D1DC34A
MNLNYCELGQLVSVKTGRLDANAANENGMYPFFTCAKEPLLINKYAFDADAILVAGNGDLNVKHYKGKFNAYQRTYVITIDEPTRLCSRYLFHFMDKYVEKLREQSIGGVIKYIKLGMLTDAKLPLPTLEEQKRIAAILDKADAIRQKRQQAIALADDFLRSVFLDMFGDPITNPKGWDLSTIGKLGNVITGSTPSSKKTGMFDGDIPFVTPGDLETDAPVSRTLTDEGALNSRTCRKGTTLVCCIGATIGKIGIASRTSAFNQQINAIEWGSEIDDEFGFFAMKLMKATIISSAIQTTLPILNKSAFSALAMYLPPKNLQMKFSKIYKSTCQLNGENKKFTINSNILFDSLLQKSFSGQL